MAKMRKTVLAALVAGALLLTSVTLPSMAEHWNDSWRVRNGRANGSINPHEMHRIRQNRRAEQNFRQYAKQTVILTAMNAASCTA